MYENERKDEIYLLSDGEERSDSENKGSPSALLIEETADYESEDILTEEIERQLTIERAVIEELENEAKESPPDERDENEAPERKQLRREVEAASLARLEDAARTQADFENIVAWWDRLDANRERRERYHEILRSGDDIPLDYGASTSEPLFPDTLSGVLEKQIRAGDFLDAIFYCPYDVHEFVTEEYLSKNLYELSEGHKELLFLWAVCLFSSARIAAIRGQTDRNIRKVRTTMLKKIRKKLLAALKEKAEKQQSMTLQEKKFLAENGGMVDGEKTR
ncbi:hypothetical protein [Porcincola intestinalis]|uniref:Uncharacterized protein n=1 Tax=Porcincola intestinalis TaxID=2606632 RepID=A0A6L5X339_9FIRM|nr:hypothetical protein [Porcincola intestinalis]MSS14045.1 hypothetical protein [Porcincola intestinalis]